MKGAAGILGIPWKGLGATSVEHLGHGKLDPKDRFRKLTTNGPAL